MMTPTTRSIGTDGAQGDGGVGGVALIGADPRAAVTTDEEGLYGPGRTAVKVGNIDEWSPPVDLDHAGVG